ncbi:MAG: AAA family ATPase [Gammaproteobacteria bacterium]|nr:AAA family ATPase [Gammaproteobacteria bacterium]
MPLVQQIVLYPFRLDIANQQLWHADRKVALRSQAFAVLRYLAERPNRLIGAQELLHKVWRGRFVSTSTIRGCIREIRLVLQDLEKNPPYIETVGRKGYRLIGQQRSFAWPLNAPAADCDEPPIVGRHHELDQLREQLTLSEAGARQLVLISGEAGLGKTTLANLFLQEAGKAKAMLIGRGRCVVQCGHGEPYLPIVDVLYNLAQSQAKDNVLSALRRHAPSWLTHLTMFLDDSARDSLRQPPPGGTQARLFQELNHLLIGLSKTQPLLMLIEDLHWCDAATLELIAYLAQCQEPARWMLLGTYRGSEVNLRKHKLREVSVELQTRGRCHELALGPLGIEEISAYLHSRLDGPIVSDTVRYLHRRTRGNALFLNVVVRYLLQNALLNRALDGWQVKTADVRCQTVPLPLQQLIVKQFEQLPEFAQRLLEVASVGGETFATAAVAAGLREHPEIVDEQCDRLVRWGSLLGELDTIVWPDGTASGRFQFHHALYRQVIYERLGQAHRSQLHQRLAVRMEAGYGGRVGEIAGELALHFEKGRDVFRAVRYYRLATKTAATHHTRREVLVHS